ncbi:MAG: Rrf2 family transcriptional regulator [Elusimicrobiales bacterium]|nr:Rrf2 family transcriptional regulator [Elusimicrobiales bacterium]
MKLLKKETDYAIRALIFIAKKTPSITAVSDIDKQISVSKPFLRKILQNLNKQGILISQKGKGGGFVLAKKPEKLFLKDIMKIFQGDLQLNNCIFDKKICQNHKTCILRNKISSIEKTLLSEIEKIKLSDLMEQNPT